jgi:HAD superfamily hydrolase (TIGR01549 family)
MSTVRIRSVAIHVQHLPRRIQALLFDWGNTLVDYPLDTESKQIVFLKAFLHAPGIHMPRALQDDLQRIALDTQLVKTINAENTDYVVRPFIERLKPHVATRYISQLSRIEYALCRRIFKSGKLLPGVRELFGRLREIGIPTGIVSNTPWGTSHRIWRSEVCQFAFVQNVISAIVFCGDVGVRKPHPAMLVRCMNHLASNPPDTLLIGDNFDSDIAAARAAGCNGIWFTRGRAIDDCSSISRLSELYTYLHLLR